MLVQSVEKHGFFLLLYLSSLGSWISNGLKEKYSMRFPIFSNKLLKLGKFLQITN